MPREAGLACHMFDRQKGAARRRMDLRVRLFFRDGLGVASCGIWHKLHDPTQQRQACPAEEDGIIHIQSRVRGNLFGNFL